MTSKFLDSWTGWTWPQKISSQFLEIAKITFTQQHNQNCRLCNRPSNQLENGLCPQCDNQDGA